MSTKPYLTNKVLLAQFQIAKDKGHLTDELSASIMLIVQRIGSKNNFRHSPFIEEMQSRALLTLVEKWDCFDPKSSNNLFSYYTTIIHHAMLRELRVQARHDRIKSAYATTIPRQE